MKKYFSLLLLIALLFIIGCNKKRIPIENTKVFQSRDSIWKNFRDNFPFHLQTFGVYYEKSDNSTLILISEPPPHVEISEIKKYFKNGLIEIKQHSIGYNGWVKDIIIINNDLDNENDVKEKIEELGKYVFFTNYKSHYLHLPIYEKPKQFLKGILNYELTNKELYDWFFNKVELLNQDNDKTDYTLKNIFESNKQGIFYSKNPGFVVWVLQIDSYISEMQEQIRKYFLDSDLLLGAFKVGNSIALIGRERENSVFDLPPLRAETVILLAGSNNNQIQQSYERDCLIAGKLKDSSDWAPIYLSEELIDTEYGSLLNITDQMLKSWSENGCTKYTNFRQNIPNYWAFKKPLMKELGVDELVYNWNTYGLSYSSQLENVTILTLNKTGALPVTYQPEVSSNIKEKEITSHELIAYDYFANLNNPNLIRATQYAYLYQIFKNCNIKTKRNFDISKENKIRAKIDNYLNNKSYTIICKIKSLEDEKIKEVAIHISSNIKDISKKLEEIARIKLKSMYPLMFNFYLNFQINSLNEIKNQIKKDLRNNINQNIFDDINNMKKIVRSIEGEYGSEGLRNLSSLLSTRSQQNLDEKILRYSKGFRYLFNSYFKNYEELKLLGFDINIIMQEYAYSYDIFDIDNPKWIKTPSIVISKNISSSGEIIGGHNIDATIPKIVEDNTIKKGFFKVIKTKKGIVISGTKEDIRNISIESLEKAGRLNNINDIGESTILKIGKNSETQLVKERSTVFPVSNRIERGFSTSNNISIERLERGFNFNGRHISDCNELVDEINNFRKLNKDNSLSFIFKNFNDDEAIVILKSFELKSTFKEIILKKGKLFDFTSTEYNFNKIKMSYENSDFIVEIPKTVNINSKIFIKVKSVANGFFPKIKEIFSGLIHGSKRENFKLFNEFNKELKANNISFESIQIELADCTFCSNYFLQLYLKYCV